MKVRQVLPVAGLGLGLVGLGFVGWWALGERDEPVEVASAARPSKQASPAAKKPGPAGRSTWAPKTRAVPPAASGRAPADEELPAGGALGEMDREDRRELRSMVREDLWTDTEARFFAYVADAGWDPGTTDQVHAILKETSDGVTKRLARVDGQNVTWDEVRPEVRDFRIDQVDKIRDVLGEDAFLDFADGMDFWRNNSTVRTARGGKHLPGEE